MALIHQHSVIAYCVCLMVTIWPVERLDPRPGRTCRSQVGVEAANFSLFKTSNLPSSFESLPSLIRAAAAAAALYRFISLDPRL